MTIEDIVHALGGQRRGAGWVAHCPAHQDESPSLSVSERDGRVLVHCFGGCPQDAVIDALRERGLWPERKRPAWTPQERARYARQRRELERDLPAARHWKRAMVLLTDEVLDALKAGLVDPAMPAPEPGEIRHLQRMFSRLKSQDRGALVQEYRSWRTSHPALTVTLVRIGRRRAAGGRAWLAMFIEETSKDGGGVAA